MKTGKSLLSTFVAILCAIGIVFVSCSSDDNDKQVSPQKLPQAISTFMSTFFPGDDITYATKDRDSYDIHTKSGAEVDFNLKGEWQDVDMPAGAVVPSAIVPSAILAYSQYYYPTLTINEISVERYGYSVEYSNGLDLMFNAQGAYIGVDQ